MIGIRAVRAGSNPLQIVLIKMHLTLSVEGDDNHTRVVENEERLLGAKEGQNKGGAMSKSLGFLIFLAIIFCGESVSSGATGQAASGPQLAKDCAEALNKNNYPQAEACNEKLLLMYPGQKALYYNLAIAQYNQRKYEEAAGNLYKAIDLGIAANPQIDGFI